MAASLDLSAYGFDVEPIYPNALACAVVPARVGSTAAPPTWRGSTELSTLGDALSDQIAQQALATPQWQEVKAQLDVEGITNPLTVTAVQSKFVDSVKTLLTDPNFNIDPSNPATALDSAKELCKVGYTALGAVNTVSGLVHDLSTGNVASISNAFMGGVVALAVGAGAVSAGVGAAIVGVASMAIEALSSLFAQPPGYQIPGCGNTSYSNAPQLAVGCIAGFCDPKIAKVQPHSLLWRSFPVPGTATDAMWFAVPSSPILGDWKLVTWWTPSVAQVSGGASPLAAAPTPRPIDVAFTNYAWVERGATRDRMAAGFSISISPFSYGSEFLQAFASAWRANAEYAFNGLQPQDDTKILLQFLRFWNRAHSDSAQVTMYQGGNGSYAESLVQGALALVSSSDDFVTSDSGLRVNLGDLKQTVVAATPAGGGGGGAPAAPTTQSGGGGTGTAVAATVIVAAAAGGIWLALGQPLTLAAAKAAFGAAFDTVSRKLLP